METLKDDQLLNEVWSEGIQKLKKDLQEAAMPDEETKLNFIFLKYFLPQRIKFLSFN